MTIGAIVSVIVAGQLLLQPVFRYIAETRLREMFTAVTLLVVAGIALLMISVGLSPALGTFLAGVVLANSEYRHELESDIEPFKGLLLGLFFITVGARIDFTLLSGHFAMVLGLTLGVMTLKAIVLLALAKLFKVNGGDGLLFALGLAQAGEFGFVLLSFSQQFHAIDADTSRLLSLVVALSMFLTPLLFIMHGLLAREDGQAEQEADVIEKGAPIIIAGLGRFGQVVNRILLSNGFATVVLDHRASYVSFLRKFSMRGYYGDATRPDLLHSAGLKTARLLVVAIDDAEKATELVRYAKRENPNIHVVARAHDRPHVYRLFNAGADDIVRETFNSSVRAGRYALKSLGLRDDEANEAADFFVGHDTQTLRQLAALWREETSVFANQDYIEAAKERERLLEEAMLELRRRQSAAATP